MKKTLSLVMSIIIIVSVVKVSSFFVSAEESLINSYDIVSISAGKCMSAAVRADGSLWTWGSSHLDASGSRWGNSWSIEYGNPSLGIATGTLVKGTPMMAFSESTKSVKCATNFSGSYYSQGDSYYPYPVTAALKDDNSLWMWGGVKYGVLGNETDGERSCSWEPTKVLENVISYDTSGYHSAAVTSDGSLYMWGKNDCGQLGDGSNESRLSPIKIQGMENVTEVKLGKNFSAALKSDDSLWIWGANNYGQLGNGTADGNVNSVPRKVLDDVKSFALSNDSCAAVKTDGSVLVWGYNAYGELGIGNKNNQYYPVENENFYYDAKLVEAGENHFAVITIGNDLYLWGSNTSGQLGIGSSGYTADIYGELIPIQPRRVLRNVEQVALGSSHSIALKKDGTLWSWGSNGYGQLGDRSTEERKLPVEIHLGRIDASFKGDNMPEAKTLDIPWDGIYLYDESNAYNKDMAISGIVLSEAAYSNSNVFKQFGYKYAGSGSSNINRPAFHIYYRVIWNFDSPKVEIIMAIRGTNGIIGDGGLTDDALSDIRSTTDCFDGATNELLNSLSFAQNTIINDLKKKNINVSITKRNTRYFLTGHSLGAACAAKIGISLVENGLAFPNNVYVYTYASPRCITDYEQALSVPRCFNIINECDTLVPNMPGFVLWRGFPIRPGYDKYYFGTDSNNSFMNALFQLYGEYPGDRYTPLKAHMTPVYLASILSAEPRTTVNKVFSRARMIEVHCPVEVEVYDSMGNLCANTKNGEVNYEKNSAVIIQIDGDEKYIVIPDDSNYTVKYIGTDTGTMRINEKIYDLENETIDTEKVFNNIALEKNKLFSSNIDASDNTENTDLFVIDNEGDNIKSVDQNGKETVLAKYDISDFNVELSADAKKYDGTEKQQTVNVYGLTEGKDYRIIYKNNIEVGTATVVVKGINEYFGRFEQTFEIYDNGSDGSINWQISADGTLVISGEGNMPDYDIGNLPAWSKHKNVIKKVSIENTVTSVGAYAFYDCLSLKEAIIPDSITEIKANVFSDCANLTDVYYIGTEQQKENINIDNNNYYLLNAIWHITRHTPGDANGDDLVNNKDITRLFQYLSDWDVNVNESALDINGDGKVNNKDLTRLFQYLSGWAVEIF